MDAYAQMHTRVKLLGGMQMYTIRYSNYWGRYSQIIGGDISPYSPWVSAPLLAIKGYWQSMVWNGMEDDFFIFHTGSFPFQFHTKNFSFHSKIFFHIPFHTSIPKKFWTENIATYILLLRNVVSNNW